MTQVPKARYWTAEPSSRSPLLNDRPDGGNILTLNWEPTEAGGPLLAGLQLILVALDDAGNVVCVGTSGVGNQVAAAHAKTRVVLDRTVTVVLEGVDTITGDVTRRHIRVQASFEEET